MVVRDRPASSRRTWSPLRRCDPAGYEQYKALARPIAEKFGGEYLVRGGELRVDDDDLWSPTRMVIISFPDLAAANACRGSDEYAPVKEMRRRYAKSTVVMVDDGMPG